MNNSVSDYKATVHSVNFIKLMIMGKNSKCITCELRFPSLEGLKSEVRLQRHEKTPHKIPCGECDLVFISRTHLNFQLRYSHDCRCQHCYTLCEGSCSETYASAIETAGNVAMEKEKIEKKTM